jgi:hypothetical protein
MRERQPKRANQRSGSSWITERIGELYTHETRRLELYVRSMNPQVGIHGPQERVLECLRQLDDQGVVDSVTISVWGSHIALEGEAAQTGVGRTALDTVERIRQWAVDHDASVEQFFDERQVNCQMTGESYSVLVPPSMCLLAYADDELLAVAPCTKDGETMNLWDCLGALEREATVTLPAAESGA